MPLNILQCTGQLPPPTKNYAGQNLSSAETEAQPQMLFQQALDGEGVSIRWRDSSGQAAGVSQAQRVEGVRLSKTVSPG